MKLKKILNFCLQAFLDKDGVRVIFHSFRHTFTTKAIEKKVPSEYQNALGGWVDNGIRQRVYGKEKNINVMLEELSKVTYPIHKELKELAARFRTSYVINILQR